MALARRSKAGGAKKRPTRYEAGAALSDKLARALRYQKKGCFSEAALLFREVVASEPRSLDAWMNLGATCALLGLAREARAAFDEAGQIAPADARVQRDRGIGLFAIGRVQEAADALEGSLRLDPRLAGARLVASRVLIEAGDKEGAIACAREGAAIHPIQASMHLELHRALYDDSDPERALSPASRAVELDPTWWLARYALAGARALSTGDVEAALEAERSSTSGAVRALRFAFEKRASKPRYFSSTIEVLSHAASIARPGPIVELGVRHGTSTRILAKHAAAHGMAVHAFDSFQGLPEPFYGRPPGAFTTRGEIPELPDNVDVHVGWFEETLPAWASRSPSPPTLVHIDSDLYSSACTALDQLGPLLSPGAILVFDEYLTNERWEDDEHKAFQDAATRFGWSYEYVAFNLFTGQAVIRIDGLKAPESRKPVGFAGDPARV